MRRGLEEIEPPCEETLWGPVTVQGEPIQVALLRLVGEGRLDPRDAWLELMIAVPGMTAPHADELLAKALRPWSGR